MFTYYFPLIRFIVTMLMKFYTAVTCIGPYSEGHLVMCVNICRCLMLDVTHILKCSTESGPWDFNIWKYILEVFIKLKDSGPENSFLAIFNIIVGIVFKITKFSVKFYFSLLKNAKQSSL